VCDDNSPDHKRHTESLALARPFQRANNRDLHPRRSDSKAGNSRSCHLTKTAYWPIQGDRQTHRPAESSNDYAECWSRFYTSILNGAKRSPPDNGLRFLGRPDLSRREATSGGQTTTRGFSCFSVITSKAANEYYFKTGQLRPGEPQCSTPPAAQGVADGPRICAAADSRARVPGQHRSCWPPWRLRCSAPITAGDPVGSW